MVRIQWGGEDLCLFAERAVLWERRQTLLLADPHFGKAAAFRSAGVPVPEAATEADLRRLDFLLKQTVARQMIVLGDFLHARAGWSEDVLDTLGAWRKRWPHLSVILVRGNHDVRAGDPPPAWGIDVVAEPWVDGPFAFCHDPAAGRGGLVIAGHYHPAVVLEGNGGECLRAPCFAFGPQRALLPAFGSFTGCKTIRARPGERIFVVGEGEVVEAAVQGFGQ